MKRLVLVVAALGMAGMAHAQDAEIKNSGEVRVRYHNIMKAAGTEANATTRSSSNSLFNHRLKWNITARKGENLQAMVSLLNNAQWGQSTLAEANTGTPDYSTYNQDNEILVNRAWGWWKSSDALSFKFGRMGMEIADGAVFAENDWEEVPTTHEGVVAMWDSSFAKVSVFGLKQFDLNTASATHVSQDPESNLYGASLDFKNMPEAIKTANLHILQRNVDEIDAGANATNAISRTHVGLTVGGDVSNILYKATGAMQFGKAKDRTTTPGTTTSTDINAMMYDLMVGYQLPELMGLKATVGYHYDTGDKASADKNETYDPMFYDRHNYSGLMDVIGWGNLNYIDINLAIMPLETLEAGVGFYMFNRTSDTTGANLGDARGTGTTYLSNTGTGTSKKLGNELDVYANKSYDNGFKIGARYSMFMVGDYFKGGTAKMDKSPSEIFLQASLSF